MSKYETTDFVRCTCGAHGGRAAYCDGLCDVHRVKSQITTFWAGYSDGEIATTLVDTGFGGTGCTFATLPMLFKSKRAARLQFEDVRKVRIVEVANGKR